MPRHARLTARRVENDCGHVRTADGLVAVVWARPRGCIARLGRRRPSPRLPAPRGPLTSAEAVEMVRAHNAWRARAGVLSLRWAADLAAQAQNRAIQLARQDCALEHGLLPDDVGEPLPRERAQRDGRRRALRRVAAPGGRAHGTPSRRYSPASGSCAPGASAATTPRSLAATEEVGCASWAPPWGRSGSALPADAATSAS